MASETPFCPTASPVLEGFARISLFQRLPEVLHQSEEPLRPARHINFSAAFFGGGARGSCILINTARMVTLFHIITFTISKIIGALVATESSFLSMALAGIALPETCMA